MAHTHTTTYKPVGLIDLETLLIELLKMNTHNNHPFSVSILNNLIQKVEIIINKLKYNPRLPMVEIEHEIIDMCNKDKTLQGVMVNIFFTNKFGEINAAYMGKLNVNV